MIDSGQGPNPFTALPVEITLSSVLEEVFEINRKLAQGAKRLAEFTEQDLAIATAPADEIHREDMVRLYKYRPLQPKTRGVVACIERYQFLPRSSSP